MCHHALIVRWLSDAKAEVSLATASSLCGSTALLIHLCIASREGAQIHGTLWKIFLVPLNKPHHISSFLLVLHKNEIPPEPWNSPK